jgi:hypothetical protein
MKSNFTILRGLGLSLAAMFAVVQGVQAAETYGPRNTVRFEALPTLEQVCDGKVSERKMWYWDGTAKSRKSVRVRECAEPKAVRKVKHWVGPRGTIPVYE